MALFAAFLAVATAIASPLPQAPRVVVTISGCADCAQHPPGVEIWDETIEREVIPDVSHRRSDGFTLTLPPGYYDVLVRSDTCNGERYLGVLPQRDRRFKIAMRCAAKGVIASVRLVDRMRGLAGTLPQSASGVTMRAAEGFGSPIRATISRGAYYFDEANCGNCVLTVTLAGGAKAIVAATPGASENFSLVRNDITTAMVQKGLSVRGSPFNAPENLVEGPAHSIWVLDRLGNRVAVIGANGRSREIDLPTPFAGAQDIVGTSNAVWVSETSVGKVVRFDATGRSKEYDVAREADDTLRMILGPRNQVWFIDGTRVGTIDDRGDTTMYEPPGDVVWIGDLAQGSDGDIWIIGYGGFGKGFFIARMDTAGEWRRFALKNRAYTMRAAPTGFWITGDYDSLSFVDLQGRETGVTLPVKDMEPKLYAVDPSGDLWFSDRYGNMILRATKNGVVSSTYTDFGPAGISDMQIDEAGHVWIAEPKAEVVEEYDRGLALPPRGVRPKHLLFDEDGVLWYSDPVADVVGTIGRNGKGRCYAFRLSKIRRCSFERSDLIVRD